MLNIVENERSFLVSTTALFLPDEIETAAWYSNHLVRHPAMSYVVGAFVEADRANSNGQYFALADLQQNYRTVVHTPLNINHVPDNIFGTVVAAELLYPTQAAADGEVYDHPRVEIAAAVWRTLNPTAYELLRRSQSEGAAAFSMEAIPERLRCGECAAEFSYDGRTSPGYCAHLQHGSAARILVNPLFVGAGLILPPLRPGWKHADVHTLAASASAGAMNLDPNIAADAEDPAPDGCPTPNDCPMKAPGALGDCPNCDQTVVEDAKKCKPKAKASAACENCTDCQCDADDAPAADSPDEAQANVGTNHRSLAVAAVLNRARTRGLIS